MAEREAVSQGHTEKTTGRARRHEREGLAGIGEWATTSTITGTPAYNTVDKQELRKFGLVFATGIALIFGLFLPWLFDRPWPLWTWIVAGVFTVTALLLPQALRPVFWLWMKFGHVLGWINTRNILGITFLLFFVPVALILHLFFKDPMRRRLDLSASSYRIKSESLPHDRMEKPF